MKYEFDIKIEFLLMSSYVFSGKMDVINNNFKDILLSNFAMFVNSYNSFIIHTFADD